MEGKRSQRIFYGKKTSDNGEEFGNGGVERVDGDRVQEEEVEETGPHVFERLTWKWMQHQKKEE